MFLPSLSPLVSLAIVKVITCLLELVGLDCGLVVFFLCPGIVELAINALYCLMALFLRQHAVAEHQDLGAFYGKVPALIRQSLLQVIEIGACRLGARVASPVTTALARSALARPCIRVKDSSLTRRIRVEIGRASCRERVCQYV